MQDPWAWILVKLGWGLNVHQQVEVVEEYKKEKEMKDPSLEYKIYLFNKIAFNNLYKQIKWLYQKRWINKALHNKIW